MKNLEKNHYKNLKQAYKNAENTNKELIKSYKESIKSTNEKVKANKKDLIKKYKSERDPFKIRFIGTIKLIIAKAKKIYNHIFKAWLMIVELKDEIIKLKEELENKKAE